MLVGVGRLLSHVVAVARGLGIRIAVGVNGSFLCCLDSAYLVVLVCLCCLDEDYLAGELVEFGAVGHLGQNALASSVHDALLLDVRYIIGVVDFVDFALCCPEAFVGLLHLLEAHEALAFSVDSRACVFEGLLALIAVAGVARDALDHRQMARLHQFCICARAWRVNALVAQRSVFYLVLSAESVCYGDYFVALGVMSAVFVQMEFLRGAVAGSAVVAPIQNVQAAIAIKIAHGEICGQLLT